MKFKIKVDEKNPRLNHKGANVEKLKTNLDSKKPVQLVCHFYNMAFTETPHVETHLKCGDTVLSAAIALDSFKNLELELVDQNFKPFNIYSFPLSQGMKKFGEYLKALISHIELTHNLSLPKQINIIGTDQMILDIL